MADQQIRVVTGLLKEAAEKVVTRLSVNVTAELIEATPVDTGWARANWVPAIGLPVTDPALADTREDRVAGVAGKRNEQQSAIARLATGGYDLSRGAVFISNNVPYIVNLNEGSSAQAPAAFVQAAIQRGIASLGDRIPR